MQSNKLGRNPFETRRPSRKKKPPTPIRLGKQSLTWKKAETLTDQLFEVGSELLRDFSKKAIKSAERWYAEKLKNIKP